MRKKKKKEESKFFTRTLSRKESPCLCVSFESESERERKRESNVGRRVRRRDRCVALFYRGGFQKGEQSWFRKRLKVKSS